MAAGGVDYVQMEGVYDLVKSSSVRDVVHKSCAPRLDLVGE